MGTLGSACTYTAQIHTYLGYPKTSACGPRSALLAGIDDITSVRWGRALDDTSTATINVSPCQSALWNLIVFRQPLLDLILYRDNQRVWRGPVVGSDNSDGTLRLSARDLTEWFNRRRARASIATMPNSASVVEWMRRTIQAGFGIDPDTGTDLTHPCIPSVLVELASTVTVDKTWLSNSMFGPHPLTNDLAELAALGGDWYQHIDSIVLRDEATDTEPALATLSSDDFEGGVKVIGDSSGTATSVTATGTVADNPASATAEDLSAELVWERWIEARGANTHAGLYQLAQRELRRALPPHIGASTGSGAGLLPSAPIDINELEMGRRIDVYTPDLGGVTSSFRLSGVDVTWDASGERVGMAFAPLVSTRLG